MSWGKVLTRRWTTRAENGQEPPHGWGGASTYLFNLWGVRPIVRQRKVQSGLLGYGDGREPSRRGKEREAKLTEGCHVLIAVQKGLLLRVLLAGGLPQKLDRTDLGHSNSSARGETDWGRGRKKGKRG